MKKTLKILFNTSRILLGLVFVFSGFVKAIDPLGSAYKFSEYFSSVGLPEMHVLSLVMSFLLSGAEFLIGVALVTGVFFNLTIWTALFFMVFFTILTFLLAVFNPVSDCGCFGDAIKLTNWETFFKNIIFSSLIAFLFLRRKQYKFNSSTWLQIVVTFLTIIICFGFSLYSYFHLPIIDFMPYKTGTNIIENMIIPKNAPQDQFETHLIYKHKKSGLTREFSMNNYPWQDTVNWKWMETKTVLIKKGYTPPIHDFLISSPIGNNITDSILSDTSNCFLFISKNINKVNLKEFNEVMRIASYCSATGKCKFYAITSSTKQEVENIKKQYNLWFEFNSADETTLKTMIRANPGLILLKNGTIIGKWHYKDMHKVTFESDNFLAKNLNKIDRTKELQFSLNIFLGMGLIISILWALSFYFKK